MPDMTKPYAHLSDAINSLKDRADEARRKAAQYKAEAEILEYVLIKLRTALIELIEVDKENDFLQSKIEGADSVEFDEGGIVLSVDNPEWRETKVWYRCERHSKPGPEYSDLPGTGAKCDICDKTATTYGPRRD